MTHYVPVLLISYSLLHNTCLVIVTGLLRVVQCHLIPRDTFRAHLVIIVLVVLKSNFHSTV